MQRAHRDRPGSDFSYAAQVQIYIYTDMYDIEVFLYEQQHKPLTGKG